MKRSSFLEELPETRVETWLPSMPSQPMGRHSPSTQTRGRPSRKSQLVPSTTWGSKEKMSIKGRPFSRFFVLKLKHCHHKILDHTPQWQQFLLVLELLLKKSSGVHKFQKFRKVCKNLKNCKKHIWDFAKYLMCKYTKDVPIPVQLFV